MYEKKDYAYHLPEELIAKNAADPHHNARLLVIDKGTGKIDAESDFWSLDQYLGSDRVLFFNNSRVLRARIPLIDIPYVTHDGSTKRLKAGEIFFLKKQGDTSFEALVRPGNKFKIGSVFQLGKYNIEVSSITQVGRLLRIINNDNGISELLETYGKLPLPPYIEYTEEKGKDYQTSFAKKDGSVAAPTASLHFTPELLEKLENQKEYITLHVGIGTFKGIDTKDVRDYAIHTESAEVSIEIFSMIASIKYGNKKIVAVGTTACRTLESLPYIWKRLEEDIKESLSKDTHIYWNALSEKTGNTDYIQSLSFDKKNQSIIFETAIYIMPGFEFLVIDDLITNFHLPESSLIVLVSAFLGYNHTKKIYSHAINHRYRFYSFGDGMYIRGK